MSKSVRKSQTLPALWEIVQLPEYQSRFEVAIHSLALQGEVMTLRHLFEMFMHARTSLFGFWSRPAIENSDIAEPFVEAESARLFDMAKVIAEALEQMPQVRKNDAASRAAVITRWAFELGHDIDDVMVALAEANATKEAEEPTAGAEK
jgi:hypothetical protein